MISLFKDIIMEHTPDASFIDRMARYYGWMTGNEAYLDRYAVFGGDTTWLVLQCVFDVLVVILYYMVIFSFYYYKSQLPVNHSLNIKIQKTLLNYLMLIFLTSAVSNYALSVLSVWFPMYRVSIILQGVLIVVAISYLVNFAHRGLDMFRFKHDPPCKVIYEKQLRNDIDVALVQIELAISEKIQLDKEDARSLRDTLTELKERLNESG